jgi:hypothetical protein
VDGQNLSYALVQVVHNAGAVSVAGGAAFARWGGRDAPTRRAAFIVLFGWAAQALSGATFGAISYAYYGQLPDLHGIAVAALVVKMVCAACGFSLAAACLVRQGHWPDARRGHVWDLSLGLAAVALIAAAFLRWFS